MLVTKAKHGPKQKISMGPRIGNEIPTGNKFAALRKLVPDSRSKVGHVSYADCELTKVV